MTDRQSNEFSEAHEPNRTPVPPQDPPAPDDATQLAARQSDARPTAPTGLGENTGRDGDPFGPRTGGLPPIPEYGAQPRTGGSEETTVAVPQRGEGTGPTTTFGPDQGGRPTPPPPPPPGRPGPPPVPMTQQTMQMTPEQQAWIRQQRQQSARPERVAPQQQRPQQQGPQQQGPQQQGPLQPGAQQQWGTAPPGPPQQWGGPPPGQRQGPPPSGQPGPAGPPMQGPWGETSGQHGVSGGWPAEGYRGGAGQASYTYADSIRSSDLVPTRKLPPRHGWRKAVLAMTFGTVNLGRSPDEREYDELVAKTRTLLRGRYKIGVLGKGGTGKTTLSASLGSIFAELRQDDRVVAIDADTAFGKLGSRIDPHASGSYWELAADQHLNSFADIRSRVGSNAAGLFVLAGEHNVARRRVLDPAIYREATTRLDNHFTISIVDCGSTMDSPVTREALADLDALLVVSSPWVDGASAAGQTMDWLAGNGYTGLLHRTVVVLNDSDGHADKRTRNVLAEQFGSRGQVVIEVPYDPQLRPGGVIDVDGQISRVTRRRILQIAATIAEHFAATTDGPRERR